jgi:uracil phosphoribosyltransferase
MPGTTLPNLTILDHPLIQHKLTLLRQRDTSTRDFKQLVNEIAMLMAYEVTKDLPTEPVEIETPLARMTGRMVSDKKLTLVPILRAGLGMVDGISQLVPTARVGHIGVFRDESSLQPVRYYAKLPPAEGGERDYFVLDPMLATGGSGTAACTTLKAAGARRIRFLCLVAAPEGVRRMLDGHPDVRVFTAALDQGLNERGFIVPGLGDAGDRLFGTR